ncbi:DUF692 domain-containing protein [Hymenobacter sp. 15J16-1T3B]|uniref:multinuclear nonheme iron-dependent oxidase n=1 Tax=Hymenobacter sp. 15J16-1T3B TaxID=2886941 RepID=UPI001D102D5D|nr:DUF692 family multinuclear iron-containing protein [Hymenobacter sp. 15J16-1T3B]MCC3160799.1 DUF692 domain-containing protein [Hymenobacter sp. 15J16-1T3B]
MAESPSILATVACNLDADILSAAFPLLEEGRVEALEWAFDALYWTEQPPAWFADLLDSYSQAGRLIGHGVYFSLLSGRWTAEQQQWLRQLAQVAARFRFDHVTEHFGFFTGQNFHHGAPLPVPYSPAALRLGQDRLQRLQAACQCPVGLENLAFAYSLDEVQRHGEFLDQLLAPVNGFVILDLHNLYCQLHNFAVPYEALIELYPLERVREIHISGGSWEASSLVPGRTVRRDTHDEAVPDEVFALLARTLPRCPNLKYVVLEQLGTGLKTAASREQFRRDFRRMAALLEPQRTGRPAAPDSPFAPLPLAPAGPAAEDETLHEQQRQLSQILETAPSYDAARQQLLQSGLAGTDWRIEHWEPHMLETAVNIARKWKK